MSLFTTPEHGTMIQDSFNMNKTFSAFLGFEVPYFFFAVKADELQSSNTGKLSNKKIKKTLNDNVSSNNLFANIYSKLHLHTSFQ